MVGENATTASFTLEFATNQTNQPLSQEVLETNSAPIGCFLSSGGIALLARKAGNFQLPDPMTVSALLEPNHMAA